MNLKLNDMEFKDIIQLLGGFVTKENEDLLKFNLIASPDLTFNNAMQLLQSMTSRLCLAEGHPLSIILHRLPIQ